MPPKASTFLKTWWKSMKIFLRNNNSGERNATKAYTKYCCCGAQLQKTSASFANPGVTLHRPPAPSLVLTFRLRNTDNSPLRCRRSHAQERRARCAAPHLLPQQNHFLTGWVFFFSSVCAVTGAVLVAPRTRTQVALRLQSARLQEEAPGSANTAHRLLKISG